VVAVDVVVVAAVGLLGFLVLGLLRSNAELTRSLHRLGVDLSPDSPAGTFAAPVTLSTRPETARPTPGRPDTADVVDLAGTTPAGDAISLAVRGVRHDTLVAFLTSGCQTCRGFWETFRAGTPDMPGGARLAVVTRGADGESPGTVEALAGTGVPVVMSTDVWQHYDVPYAPYFVYVSGPEGRVTGEGVASTWEQVRKLLDTAATDRPAEAPVVELEGSWRKAGADAEREARIDRELAAAGILPGDPRLWPGRQAPGAGSETAAPGQTQAADGMQA
jgi:hypothetical protein